MVRNTRGHVTVTFCLMSDRNVIMEGGGACVFCHLRKNLGSVGLEIYFNKKRKKTTRSTPQNLENKGRSRVLSSLFFFLSAHTPRVPEGGRGCGGARTLKDNGK